MTPLIRGLYVKLTEAENRMVLTRVYAGRRNQGSVVKGYKVSVLQDELRLQSY